ncbi:hypothetical protein [Deinococcus misasensis]|uniref:hypothetical protein n=1 Tax=Deinococcus misasensis TaxID=392413 RepID=UPI000550DCD3|nr:hypothetical protein [Deinococcus misasensis]
MTFRHGRRRTERKLIMPLDGLSCYLDYLPGQNSQLVYDASGLSLGAWQLGSTLASDTNDPAWTPQGLTFDSTDYHGLPLQAVRSIGWVFYTPTNITPATPEIKILNDASTTNLSLGASTGALTNEVITLAWVDGAGTGRVAWTGAGIQIAAGWHVLQCNFDGVAWRIRLDGVLLPLASVGSSHRELPAAGLRRHGSSPSSMVGMTSAALRLGTVGLSVAGEQDERDFLKLDCLRKHGVVL